MNIHRALPVVALGSMMLGPGHTAAQSLAPDTAAAGRYAAPAGAPYRTEEVQVASPSGEVLWGTLTVPCGARGPVPAVLLLSGSGPQDRDEAVAPGDTYRPFRQIADTLTRRGIAVLRVDDRGFGGPHQRFASVDEEADDARAALALLRSRPDVDPSRIALVGHSEGAALAPLIAAGDSEIRAIALLASPATRLRDAIDEQIRTGVERDASLTTRAARDSALAARMAYQARATARLWSPASLDYDPRVPARRVGRAAVLVLHGATDRQVPSTHAALLADAFRAAGNRDVTVRVLPAVDHLLAHDEVGDPSRYDALPTQAVAPQVLGALADWAAARLLPRGRSGVNAGMRCR
jgi:dipeptidyl aminopeptidase/acylaminoacyl peptidase